MIFNYLKLFSVVIATVCLLHSCIETDDTLGLDFVPDGHVLDVKTKDFSIPVFTTTIDSVITNSVSYGAIGFMNNPPFGLFTAGSVFRILPNSLNYSYGESPTLDSAILRLVVSNKFLVGDQSNVNQPLKLYRLTRDLRYGTLYYNNSLKTGDYNTAVELAESYTYKGGDTILLKLTPEFAQELIDATAEQMSNDTLFRERFKGFYLKADTSGASGTGGLIAHFGFSGAYVSVNYHNAGNDTARVCLYFIENTTPNFNSFTHSSSGLADKGNPLPGAKIYVEGLAGVKPYIDFNSVKDSLVNWMEATGQDTSKLIINKAELVFDVDYPDNAMDTYPKTMTLAYKQDTVYNYVSDTQLNMFGGAINRSTQKYNFNITYFTQGLFTDHHRDKVRELHLHPITVSYDSYGYTTYALNKLDYSFGVLKGYTNGQSNVKLKLTYTILK